MVEGSPKLATPPTDLFFTILLSSHGIFSGKSKKKNAPPFDFFFSAQKMSHAVKSRKAYRDDCSEIPVRIAIKKTQQRHFFASRKKNRLAGFGMIMPGNIYFAG